MTFFRLKPSFNWVKPLRHALLAVLFSLCLPVLFSSPALALSAPTAASQKAAAESDRMAALVACLPKQLGQPDLKRTLSEMGNDQLERMLNLKPDPKLSQAETELKTCMNRKGFFNSPS